MNQTPEQSKAHQLIEKFRKYTQVWDYTNDMPLEDDYAKQCALICVDEIIAHNKIIQEKYDGYQTYNTPMKLYKEVLNPDLKFWNKVKTEIENYRS